MDVNVSAMRTPYKGVLDALNEDDMVKEPYTIFKDWFAEAVKIESIKEANAMALATATKEGVPSVRSIK